MVENETNGEQTKHFDDIENATKSSCIDNSHRINIVCDQITFDASEETITIHACKLKSGLYKQELTTYQSTTSNGNIKTIPNQGKLLELNTEWSIRLELGDVICLTVIVIILLIWLSIFIFYVNKDNEYNP